jgi:hypothetical protein
MDMASTGGEVPFVSYQHGSGTDEVLRPTLMTVSDGRSYRKMTEVEFGPKRREVGAATRPKADERHPVHPFNGMTLSQSLAILKGNGIIYAYRRCV